MSALIEKTDSGVEQARALLAASGLTLPPIPASLAPHFKARRDWCFASRPVRTSPYFMRDYVEHTLARMPNDYVLLAHDGHGVNSYALHYYLVHRPLMLFLQIGWGGAYMPAEWATARANCCFGLCHEVVSSMAEAVSRGAWEPRRRVLVVASSFRSQINESPPASLDITPRLVRRGSAGGSSPECALSQAAQWCRSLIT
jgi:hypothetical protein